MPVTAVEIYKALSGKIGDREAELLVEFVESSVKEAAATKEDLVRSETALREDLLRSENALREEISAVESRLRKEISGLEMAFRQEISGVETRLTQEINRLDRRITDMEWKMKLYFAVIAALIILTNPKVMEIAGRIFGFVK